MVNSGMGDGMSQGYERLDELVAKLKANRALRTTEKETVMQSRVQRLAVLNTQAEEAANFYVSLFDDSEVTDVQRLDGTPSGDNVALVFFRLAGNEFFAINGGPQIPFTEAVSIHVGVDTKAEYAWSRGMSDATVAASSSAPVAEEQVRPQ